MRARKASSQKYGSAWEKRKWKRWTSREKFVASWKTTRPTRKCEPRSPLHLLKSGLVETKEPAPKTPGKGKGKRGRDPDNVPTTPGARGGIDPFESPTKGQKILLDKHPLIVEKLGPSLAKAKRHNVGMSQLCELVGMKLWDMFPVHC